MTVVEKLSFSYGKQKIIEDLSFRVERGSCLVIAGPNGTGKSTLLSLVAGVLRPDSGTVLTGGRLGFVPQGSGLFEDMTVEENLRFFAALEKCPVPRDLPFGLDSLRKKKVSKLSGGMRKRLSIACALLANPELLLLDEPCAALDVQYRQELAELVQRLKASGCTVLYVGHEPGEFVSFYDQVLFLGRQPQCYTREQLSGTPEDIARFAENFTALFQQK